MYVNMEVDMAGNSEWSKRQNFGFEYSQYTRNLPPSIEVMGRGEQWQIFMQGEALNPPEVESCPKLSGAIVLYYKLSTFKITHRAGQKIDLVTVIPKGWTQMAINFTSPNYLAREFFEALEMYGDVNVPRQILVSGGTFLPKSDKDDFVKIALWNTLIAQFITEVGEPANEQAGQGMTAAVLRRRKEILDQLADSQGNPKLLFHTPFTSWRS